MKKNRIFLFAVLFVSCIAIGQANPSSTPPTPEVENSDESIIDAVTDAIEDAYDAVLNWLTGGGPGGPSTKLPKKKETDG